MFLECVGVNDSSDSLEKYQEMFIGGFWSFCKPVGGSHYLKNHLSVVPGLQGFCYDVILPGDSRWRLVIKEWQCLLSSSSAALRLWGPWGHFQINIQMISWWYCMQQGEICC